MSCRAAQRQALAAIEQALSAAKLPALAWYDVLLELERAGGSLRPFELERAMLLAQYNLSRLIERLEKAGYVERRTCANDRRGQVIAIIPAGKNHAAADVVGLRRGHSSGGRRSSVAETN